MLLQALLICICYTGANAQSAVHKDRLATMNIALPAMQFVHSMSEEFDCSTFRELTWKLKNDTKNTLEALKDLERETLYEALKCKFESIVEDAEYYIRHDTGCMLQNVTFASDIYDMLASALLKITDYLASECHRKFVKGFVNYLHIHIQQTVLTRNDDSAVHDALQLKAAINDSLTLVRDGISCIYDEIPNNILINKAKVLLRQFNDTITKEISYFDDEVDVEELSFQMYFIPTILLENVQLQVLEKGDSVISILLG